MGWRPSSSIVHCALTSSSQELLGQSLPNLVCSICRVRRQEIVNFMTPTQRGGSFGVKSVKLMYFSKNLLLTTQALIRQTKYVVMMTEEIKVYQNCKFHDAPGQGFLCQGMWSYKSYSETALLLLYSQA